MSTSDLEPKPILYSRRATALVLGGVSVSTIIRLERLGRLTPVKLNQTLSGSTYYRAEEVHALANGEGHSDA